MRSAERLEQIITQEIRAEDEIERLNVELGRIRHEKRRIEREWLEERTVTVPSPDLEEAGRHTAPSVPSNDPSDVVKLAHPNIGAGPLTQAVEAALGSSRQALKAHQIAAILRSAGRNDSEESINTTLSNLRKKHRVNRVSRGLYELRAGQSAPLLAVLPSSDVQTGVDGSDDPPVPVS